MYFRNMSDNNEYYLGPFCKLREWIIKSKVNWRKLLSNSNFIYIVEYDYKAMKERMNIIAEELIANRFHPRNFDKFVSWGFEDFELDC